MNNVSSSLAETLAPNAAAGRWGLSRQIATLEYLDSVSWGQSVLSLVKDVEAIAEAYFLLRDQESLSKVSDFMARLPFPSAVQSANYYRAMVLLRHGRLEAARSYLEPLASDPTCHSRARAIHSIGGIHLKEGKLDDAGNFYIQAIGSARGNDVIAELCAQFTLSAIKSQLGDHKGAHSDLRELWPIVRLAAQRQPFYYYVYHADLAYELGALGRLPEAKAACAVALASPFAAAYPEWSETRDELAQKSRSARRSFVAVAEFEPRVQTAIPAVLRTRPPIAAARLWILPEKSYQRSTGSLALPSWRLKEVNIQTRPVTNVEIRGPPSGSDK